MSHGQADNVADRWQADWQGRACAVVRGPDACVRATRRALDKSGLAGRGMWVWALLASSMLVVAPCGHAAPLRAADAGRAVQDVPRSDGLHAQPVTGVQADALPRVADVEPGLFLPAESSVGLAAFWSGPELMVVVDHALPALFHLPAQGGLFDRRESVALAGATLLRLYLPEHPALVVERQKAGWLLCVARKGAVGRCAPPTSLPAARMQPEPARMLFAQSQPGRVITLPDPVTGGRLFVATTRQVEAPVPPRAGVGYAVRPGVLGLVVAADSAQLVMTSTPAGPVLEALAAQPVPVGLPAPPPAASVRQGEDWFWLGLRDDPAPRLLQKWRNARDGLGQAGEDHATVLAGQPEAAVMRLWSARVAAAQAAFAAGYPQQAWALLRDLPMPAGQAGGAGTGWPGPGVQALRACAALLSADMAGAAPLATADWAFRPDMVVWRGAYFMASGADSQPTSVLLARGYARLEQYPAPVRAWLLPQVSRYLAEFGGPDERAALGTLPADAAYNLARSVRQLRDGQTETARVALENLTASGNDRVADGARALLVGLLRAQDQISPDMAVEAYAQLLAAQVAEGGASSAAGGGAVAAAPDGVVQEVADLRPPLRLAYAQALAQAGQPGRAEGVLDGLAPSAQTPRDQLAQAWRTVLSGLIFGPSQGGSAAPVRAGLHGPQHGVAERTAHGPAASAPEPARGQMLALARARMDQVPDDPFKAKLLAGLGRQLMAQGRAGQAVPALQQADVLAIDPLMRADIEEQLAQSALEANQRPLALRALERSALADLPADLAARRRYDEARLAAASGNREGAQALLAEDESDTGLSVRGALYEQDQQWAQAVQVVGRLASRTLPEQGVLSTAQRDLVIRLASDAAAAGDGPTARSLQAWVGARALGAERQALFTALVKQAQKAPVVSLGVVRVPTTFDKSVKDPK